MMSDKASGGRGRRWRAILAGIALVLLAAGAAVYAMAVQNARGKAPKALNQPTEAREVRPFSTKPDKRFAPLPFEREKHDK
jgi:hypothetical protein